MSLASIDTSVYYEAVLPSTGKKIMYRPFNVREEKALLTAQESESTSTMLSTLEMIVRNCTKKCPDKLTTFDIEYMFVFIRSKSVGEDAAILTNCTHCSTQNRIMIDLTKVELTNPGQNKLIKLNDNLQIQMRYPSIEEVAKLTEMNQSEQVTNAIASAIETVYHGETVYHTSEGDTADIVEFLLNRTDPEILKLITFIEEIPTVTLNTDYKCRECGADNTLKITSLADFF